MEKTITIDGKEVSFKSTGGTPLRYKAQFRKDYLGEIMKLSALDNLPENPSAVDFAGIDFEVMYNIAWTLAKTADPTIPEPITWLDTFEEFPLIEILPEITELITSSIKTKKK